MTNFFKTLAMVFMATALAACGSTVAYKGPSTLQQSSTIEADVLCVAYGSDKVFVSSLATNASGWSEPVHSGMLAQPAKPDCSGFERDANGKILPAFMIAAANANDIRRDLATGAIGVVQSSANGVWASKVMSDNQCRGGNCGGPPVIVNALAQSASEAGSVTEVDVCDGCAAPD